MDSIILKKAQAADLTRLQKISKQTFFEAFSQTNSQEHMENYSEAAFSLEKLSEELNNPKSDFYLAELENRTIGYLKLNFGEAQTDVKDERAVEIERIYVLQEFVGKKIGQLLFEKAQEIARSKNAEYIWLGVWEKNSRALSFYKKNGFVEFGKHLFNLGGDEQTDLMMKLELLTR